MLKENIVSTKVREKLKNGNKRLLFEHKSGWVIVFDGSLNYCVFNVKDMNLGNQNRWKKGNLPNHGLSYFGKIDDAISEVYRKLIVFYKCDDVSLISAIEKAKNEIFKTLGEIRSLVELVI